MRLPQLDEYYRPTRARLLRRRARLLQRALWLLLLIGPALLYLLPQLAARLTTDPALRFLACFACWAVGSWWLALLLAWLYPQPGRCLREARRLERDHGARHGDRRPRERRARSYARILARWRLQDPD